MRSFRRTPGGRILAGMVAAMLWGCAAPRMAPHLAAQTAGDCATLARGCCASLAVPMRDSMAYRIVYEIQIRRRGQPADAPPSSSTVECMGTRDFIWSRGDSVDVLRTKEETITVDRGRRTIYRTDARLSDREVDARIATTSILRDTLFGAMTVRSCVDSAADAPLRVVTLVPKTGGLLGAVSSIVVVADPADSTARSITLNYLGARDGVLARRIIIREPARLLPYRADRDRPAVIDASSGEPAREYRGFTIVDLRHRTRN